MAKNRIYILLIGLFIFSIGILTGFFVANNKKIINSSNAELHLGGYKFINPLLECNTDENIDQEIRPFKQALVDFIKQKKGEYDISSSSVYFRDLNNGPWIGVNEKDNFSPASMLKVPLMMSLLKIVETNPAIIDQKIKISKINDSDVQFFKPSQNVEIGKTYSVDELAYRMIVYSDNTAQAEIFNLIGDDATARTYSDLGLPVPSIDNQENFMSVKNYASFFRVLFNASYLRKDLSEKALELLSEVEFKDGIVAGVPDGIVVAHKFGERTIESTDEKQLHDCGVVYYPNHPYLICIMNRGQDYNKLVSFIKSISGFVYQQVDKQYGSLK